jgi:hypothetical protein
MTGKTFQVLPLRSALLLCFHLLSLSLNLRRASGRHLGVQGKRVLLQGMASDGVEVLGDAASFSQDDSF